MNSASPRRRLPGRSRKRTRTLTDLQARLAARQSGREVHASLIERAAEIESAYGEWQRSRQELEGWEKTALKFREQDAQRQPFLREIDSEKARLEQEGQSLAEQFASIEQQSTSVGDLQEQLKAAQSALEEATTRVTARREIEARLQGERERQAQLKAENETLRTAMNPMDERIKKLETTSAGKCPLCDQDLTPQHRLETIERLKNEGREMGDRFRANKISLEELTSTLKELEQELRGFSSAESELMARSNQVAQLTERIAVVKGQVAEWEAAGAKRLAEIQEILREGKFSAEARKKLAKLDKDLAKLGYDAAAHDAARQAEASGRETEQEFSELKSAREVIKQIDSEITSLEQDIASRQSEIDAQEKQYQQVFQALEQADARLPDLDQAERELLRLREQENGARDEVTRARQLVDVLSSLRQRREGYTAEREENSKLIAQHKTLERAFGKDGVPALLIEQALPQIETKANDLLERLSDGRMSIKFTTMTEYKDKKREDLKETLDIQISDGAGMRDYEMYSGGRGFPRQLRHPPGAVRGARPAQGRPPAHPGHRRGLRFTGCPGTPASDRSHQHHPRRLCQDPGHHPPGRTEGRLPHQDRGGEDRERFNGKNRLDSRIPIHPKPGAHHVPKDPVLPDRLHHDRHHAVLLYNMQAAREPILQDITITQPEQRSITVVGTAEMQVKPDTAEFVIFIGTSEKELADAKTAK